MFNMINMINQNIDTLFFPIFLYTYKISIEYGTLFFFITVSSLSFYQFIDKKMYYFQHNDLNEYNYVGDKCRIFILSHFIIDIFNVNNIAFLIHHLLVLSGLSWSYYFNIGYNLIVYLCLNEISSIFLSLIDMNIYPKYSNIMFMITFFIFRILLLPVLTFIYKYNNYVFTVLMFDNCLHVYWVVTLSKDFLIKLF